LSEERLRKPVNDEVDKIEVLAQMRIAPDVLEARVKCRGVRWYKVAAILTGLKLEKLSWSASKQDFTVKAFFTLLRCGKVDIESLEGLKPTRLCPMLSSSIEEVGDGEHHVVGTSW
jgi:hypothetical protein